MRKHLQGRGHPPALLFFGALIACEWLLGGLVAAKAPLVASETCDPAPATPVVFRMDALAADLKKSVVTGRGNVLVRQQSWLVCCDTFEARSTADGQLHQVRCVGRVRGLIDGRRVWADEALFEPTGHLLTLRGAPRITQGRGHLEGTTITVQTETREVSIAHPRGVVPPEEASRLDGGGQMEAVPSPDELRLLTGPLPDVCPWKWR